MPQNNSFGKGLGARFNKFPFSLNTCRIACLFSQLAHGLNCCDGAGICTVHLLKIKNMQTFSRLLFVVTTTLLCSAAFAQNAKPRVSPARSVFGMVKKTNIAIAYSSPSVKGRKIWGGLVPYDSIWRAGANEATTFETDKAIKVAGKLLPPGKYGFFLLPRKISPMDGDF